MKVRKFGSRNPHMQEADRGWYLINCPGCKHEHLIAVDTPFSNGAKWSFNGDMMKPTFNPSVNIHYGASGDGVMPERRCHFFVRDGMIQFCGDCTHELVNQTVELLDIEEL